MLRLEFLQKRNCRIGAMLSEYSDSKESQSIDSYRGIQPRPLAGDIGIGFIDHDPLRLRHQRVRNAVSQPMYPLTNCLVRVFNA
jgi:hypothetical protein